MKILVLNAGSSSTKCCLYEIGDSLPETAPAPLWKAALDGKYLQVETSRGAVLHCETEAHSADETIAQMLQTLWSGDTQVLARADEIEIVGHRVVHGGRKYLGATIINPQVLGEIDRLSNLAPSHNPAALRGIEAVSQLLPDVPQIAVFDTAFHQQIPDAAATYSGPYEWLEQGISRYGFHGINHEYCARRAAQVLGRELKSLRLVSCHLGNGCSLAAIADGRSVNTTMGFTPMEGLMMGTRSGSIDPGILLHLLRNGTSVEELDRTLNHNSGLKGISGISNDLREIDAARARGDQRAQLAFDMYVHRVCFHIGAMLPSLDGLDTVVFTAGVGENSAEVRAGVCEKFEFLGLKLDADKNRNCAVDADIAHLESRVRVLVIAAQENWAIARQCWNLSPHKTKAPA